MNMVVRTDDEQLSNIEMAVLLCACDGMTTAETAALTTRSPATIKSHRSTILRKLKARTMAQAVHKAWKRELIV